MPQALGFHADGATAGTNDESRESYRINVRAAWDAGREGSDSIVQFRFSPKSRLNSLAFQVDSSARISSDEALEPTTSRMLTT